MAERRVEAAACIGTAVLLAFLVVLFTALRPASADPLLYVVSFSHCAPPKNDPTHCTTERIILPGSHWCRTVAWQFLIAKWLQEHRRIAQPGSVAECLPGIEA